MLGSWIDVFDRLPDKEVTVLVAHNRYNILLGEMEIVFSVGFVHGVNWVKRGGEKLQFVTHWMSFPDLPAMGRWKWLELKT